jgi:RNA polymerase sigma-70 factor (ECF subfamily)
MMSTALPETPVKWVLSDLDESDLVALAKAGYEAAFGELMERTRGLCLRVAGRLLSDPEEAADEVQNAFWRAYANLSGFESHSRFSTWMVRIVINCCMTRLRSEKLRTVPFDRVIEETQKPMSGQRPQYSDSPEGRLGSAEVQTLICRELQRLPMMLRRPLQYHYLEELSLNEMASRLGISLAAAKSRLSRGERYLRDRMLKHCGQRGPVTLLRA